MQLWIGHLARDPFGKPLGTIVELLSDRESGVPEWLVVSSAGDSRGRLVPVAGAEATGAQIRVVALSELVERAPEATVGAGLDGGLERRAAAHYGMTLDTDVSSTGLLRPAHEHDGQPPPHAAAGAAAGPLAGTGAAPADVRPLAARDRERIAEALQAAHGLEQLSLKRLAAMRWRVEDEELVHDLALHHKQTNRHAERVRERLQELGANRARPLEWLAKTLAYARAQAGRRHAQPDPHDLRAALELEQRELGAYEHLEGLARTAHDVRTAALARSIAADELAMKMTLEAHRLRADPAVPEGRPSPFAAPAELAEQAPRS
jgi:ferritin-like metal-binding protein YciE